MGFWDKLTGKTSVLSEVELASKAENFLRESEQLAQTNPKSAMKTIFKRPADIEPAIDFGAPFHERFANVALKTGFLVKSRPGSSAVERMYKDLPSVTVISDQEVDTLGQLIDAAQHANSDVVFMQYIKGWPKDTLAAIEALYELAIDPSALFIIHAGPNNLFIRRPYLLSTGSSLSRNTKIEKFPDELFYFAESQKGVQYNDYVVSAYNYAFCKFYRERQ